MTKFARRVISLFVIYLFFTLFFCLNSGNVSAQILPDEPHPSSDYDSTLSIIRVTPSPQNIDLKNNLFNIPQNLLTNFINLFKNTINLFTGDINTENKHAYENDISYQNRLADDLVKNSTDSSVFHSENNDYQKGDFADASISERQEKIKNILQRLESAYDEATLSGVPDSGIQNSVTGDQLPVTGGQTPGDNTRNITMNNGQFIPLHGTMDTAADITPIPTPTTYYQLPTTDDLHPTPYIPVPTLVALLGQALGYENTQDPNQTDISQPPATGNSSITNNMQPTTYNPVSPTPVIGNPGDSQPKNIYIIALLGDSMTDTLGPNLPHLSDALKTDYPDKKFALLNYGQGSTNLDSGLSRLTQGSKYLDRYYPPLLSFKPDILIIESFAYNHWGPELSDLNKQWLTYAKMVDAVKKYSPETKIIFAATIAPNANIFGDGKLNWDKNKKWESANTTKAYLQNLVNFATSQKYPLVDIYHATLGPDGNGYGQYIDTSDNLHPSDMGKKLFSKKVAEIIKYNNFIK